MKYPHTGNFNVVIAKSCAKLSEMDMNVTSAVLMFFASIDYTDLEKAQARAAEYLIALDKRGKCFKNRVAR